MEHFKRLCLVLFAVYLCSVQLVQSQISAREMLQRNKCICPCRTEGQEYFVPNNRLNWFDAASYCNAIGMSLVTIRNAGDAERLYTWLPIARRSSSYWIGANMLTTNYHLQWVLSGQETFYETWAVGEPSKRDGYCVYMKPLFPGEKTWYSDDCHKEHNFICEHIRT